MVNAQERRITMAWFRYVAERFTEAAKTYKTLNNKNYAWCVRWMLLHGLEWGERNGI